MVELPNVVYFVTPNGNSEEVSRNPKKVGNPYELEQNQCAIPKLSQLFTCLFIEGNLNKLYWHSFYVYLRKRHTVVLLKNFRPFIATT